jgi:hypothetical protein
LFGEARRLDFLHRGTAEDGASKAFVVDLGCYVRVLLPCQSAAHFRILPEVVLHSVDTDRRAGKMTSEMLAEHGHERPGESQFEFGDCGFSPSIPVAGL